MRKLTIGRIVRYVLTDDDALAINRRRIKDLRVTQTEDWPAGAQAHVGNWVQAGEIVPMIVVIVWPNEFGPDQHGVNGQAFLDGNDSLWVTSAKNDETKVPGTWHWPNQE